MDELTVVIGTPQAHAPTGHHAIAPGIAWGLSRQKHQVLKGRNPSTRLAVLQSKPESTQEMDTIPMVQRSLYEQVIAH